MCNADYSNNSEVDSEGSSEDDEFNWNCEELVELGKPLGDYLESFVMEDFV